MTAILSVICLCVALYITPTAAVPMTDVETVHIPPAAVDAAEDKTEMPSRETDDADNDSAESVKQEYTDEQLENRFVSMLNMNYCYGDTFKAPEKVAIAVAVTLTDYASDLPGYGICVNKALVAGFAESFYGVFLDSAELEFDNAPAGYVPTLCTEIGTQYHEPVSVTVTDSGYEVVTCVTFYYGGSDLETHLARSVFVENTDSEFGFNLISCSLI